MKELRQLFEKVKSENAELSSDAVWALVKKQTNIGECKLYVCNECCETFRSMISECNSCCSANVECINEIESIVKDSFKKADGKEVIIASGIVDKADAEELARRKKGKVVQGEDKKFAVSLYEGMGDDFFTTEVKYEIYGETDEDEGSRGEVSVHWKEDIEYRSWGIKDFEVRILKDLTYNDGKNDVTIPVDNIEIEWVEGYHLYPTDIEINGDKAVLTFSFCSKTK